MKASSTLLLHAALAVSLGLHTASAHIGYGGRNFGTLLGGAPVATIANQTVSSAFAWADGTDADYGDTHRGRFFRFTLTATTTVLVTAERNALGTGAPGTFLPALSLFAGLGQLAPEGAGHDSGALSASSRPGGTEGSFRALADWSIGNDPAFNNPGDPSSGVRSAARLAGFTCVGHVADGTEGNYGSAPGILGDNNADGYVTGVFSGLAPGDYSLFVGGADYGAQLSQPGPTFPAYGVTVSAQAIPEPAAAAALLGLVALGSVALRRRRA